MQRVARKAKLRRMKQRSQLDAQKKKVEKVMRQLKSKILLLIYC